MDNTRAGALLLLALSSCPVSDVVAMMSAKRVFSRMARGVANVEKHLVERAVVDVALD